MILLHRQIDLHVVVRIQIRPETGVKPERQTDQTDEDKTVLNRTLLCNDQKKKTKKQN